MSLEVSGSGITFLDDWKKVTTPGNFPLRAQHQDGSRIVVERKFDSNIETNLLIGTKLPDELSEEKLKKILNTFISLMELTNFNWGSHIYTLTNLEKCFRKSSTFSLQKAISIFQEHIEQIAKFGFAINKKYAVDIIKNESERSNAHKSKQYWTYVGVAAVELCPALLEALKKSGADMNNCDEESQSAMELVSWFHSHRDTSQMDNCVTFFVANGYNPNDKRIRLNKTHKIPDVSHLLDAIVYNDQALVKSLIAVKADIHWKNPEGDTLIGKTTEKVSNYLEAVLRWEYVRTDSVKIVMSYGIDLFETDIIKEKLKELSKSYTERTWKTEEGLLLSQASIAYIGHIKESLQAVLGVKPLTDIVCNYLNFPSLESLKYPPMVKPLTDIVVCNYLNFP